MIVLPTFLIISAIGFMATASILLAYAVYHREKQRLETTQEGLTKMHDDFTAKLVHELRAPLTVIRGTTDMIVKDPSLCAQEKGKEMLKTMLHSSEDMLTMVNDLLDVYKIEAGKFQIIKTRNNLASIIHDRVVFFSQLATAKGVSLVDEVTSSDLELDLDRERISQVLNNLLSNAIKFTPGAGKAVVTTTKIGSSSDIHWRFAPLPITPLRLPAILVAISDTGEGIPREKMPELFSKFKQLHPVNNQGSGLGLVIAKGIVESHGGQIFIESRPGEGTTVYFTLPS